MVATIPRMNEEASKLTGEISALAVEVENLGALSPEWYLVNLLSQTMVNIMEQWGGEALIDEERIISVLTDEFVARGFKLNEEQIRVLLYKPKKRFEELAILTSDYKWIIRNLRERLNNYNALFNFLKLLSWATSIKSQHPVEACWPVLKAVTLLEKEEQKRLASILGDAGVFLQTDPLINSILLMSGKISDNWLKENVPLLAGRRIYQVACEIWHPGREGGGLKRVMRNHGKAIKRLIGEDADLIHIEPYFPYGLNREGKVVEVEWEQSIKNIREFIRFAVEVGGKPVEVVVYTGKTREEDIPVFLLRDKEAYYVKMLYFYGGEYTSWEDFTEFILRAALKLICTLEERTLERLGEDYKSPVIHTNDAQTALLNVFRFFGEYSNREVLNDALFWFTTHTYGNRGIYGYEEGNRILSRWKLPEEVRWWFIRSEAGVIDISSGGIRSADGANGVSEIQVEEVKDYDKGVPLISITNGDDRSFSAKVLRGILTDTFKDVDVDVEFPEPPQIEIAKRIAKVILGLNPFQPVISYSGRLVDEKVGRKRAFTDENIEELVKMGAQVIIFGNVQPSVGSQKLYEGLIALLNRLEAKRYAGKLIVVNNFTLEEQIALLAATDIQVQDSDRRTEGAGYTEADVSANAGLQVGPPYKEGIIQAQGAIVNFAVPGEGNTIIPANPTPQSYLAILKRLIEMNPADFAKCQATSVRLSRILEAGLTAAEYLRQWNKALKRAGVISIEDTRPIKETASVSLGESLPVTAKVSLSEGVPLEEVLVQIWTNATEDGKWRPINMHRTEKEGDKYVYGGEIEPPKEGKFEYTLRASPDFGKGWKWVGKPGENRVFSCSDYAPATMGA
ncbi:MAG TPA: hypothetical protein EYP60_07800 [bacterium (Candidatus Stahlbacteria)]|nr:hypothetical protein [Candidatus Stahlbacteria bacterium]